MLSVSLFVLAVLAGIAAAASGGLAAAASGGSTAGDMASAPGEAIFVAQPGVLEFSGRMVARPHEAGDLQARGMSDSEITLRRARAASRLDAWRIRYEPDLDWHIIRVPESMDENGLSALLMSTGDYEYVVPDWICYPLASTPDDPEFGQQWHLTRINAPHAWDLATGSADVIAAFVDSGVQTDHPDIAPNLVPGYNSVDRIPQSQGGKVMDLNGHGTRVAGCIGAVGDNGIGVAGVNWIVGLMPVRASNNTSGSAFITDLNHGSLWAVQNGARCVSVSYSGVISPTVQTTGREIRELGGIALWAADNSGSNHSDFDWADVIVVGATRQDDTKASFSSYGLAIDVMAPGKDIRTTMMPGTYTTVDGTSYATPITNGLCALLLACVPTLSAGEVEEALFATCHDLGDPDNLGHGRIDAYAALLHHRLHLSFPAGLPGEYEPPGATTTLYMRVSPGVEKYVPGTAKLHYRFDPADTYTVILMSQVNGKLFKTQLPETGPGDVAEYFFSARGNGGTMVGAPGSAPAETFRFEAAFTEDIFTDDFEGTSGWTVENVNIVTGEWERGVPAGYGNRGDPLEDADGSGCCFLTENDSGDTDVDGGPTRLISPELDMDTVDYAFSGIDFSYHRWFFNLTQDDSFSVDVSADGGGTWTSVSTLTGGSGQWFRESFRVEDFVTPGSRVKVRFSVADDPDDSITEAGLDGISVKRVIADPGLWAEKYEFSAAGGASIAITLDAGPAHAWRPYQIVGSLHGSEPGIKLPGGLVLPVKQDWLTTFMRNNPSLPTFQDFSGSLDGQGRASAELRVFPGKAAAQAGKTMTFAFTIPGAFHYVSNPMRIKIKP